MRLQRAALVLIASSVPALAELPSSALAEASLGNAQLLSLAGITSLAPAAASADAALISAEASLYSGRPDIFSIDELTYQELATDSVARSNYLAILTPLNPAIFGGPTFSGTLELSIGQSGATLITVTSHNTGPSTVPTTGPTTAPATGSQITSAIQASATSSSSKGAGPTLSPLGGALGVVGLAGAVLL